MELNAVLICIGRAHSTLVFIDGARPGGLS